MSPGRAPQLDGTLGKNKAHWLAKSSGELSRIEQALYDGCHPKQRDFAWDPGRRVAAVCSRGAGKTTGSLAKLALTAAKSPGSKNLFVATSRSQGETLMWQPLKELFAKLQVRAKFNESKLRATLLDNGATIVIVGMDDKREIEKLRGIPWKCVIIDEAGSHKPQLLDDMIDKIISPRLGDSRGTITLIGTPVGTKKGGRFFEATKPGSKIGRPWEERDKPDYKDFKGWSTHHWNLQDGAPYVPAIASLWEEALIEKETNGWSDDHPTWKLEYLGLWASYDTERIFKYRPFDDDGNQFNQWDPPRDKFGLAILPKGHEWRYVIGMDMGHSDPFALVVLAFSLTNRSLYQVYEFSKKKMHAKTVAQVLIGEDLNLENPSALFGALGWPDSMVADTAGLGGMVLDELSSVYGIRIDAAKKRDKHDAIELTNGDFLDGRLFILKGSELEKELMHLEWETNDYGELKEPKGEANHHSDALVYGRRDAMHNFKEEAAPVVAKTALSRLLENEEEMAREKNEYDDFLNDDDEYNLFN